MCMGNYVFNYDQWSYILVKKLVRILYCYKFELNFATKKKINLILYDYGVLN